MGFFNFLKRQPKQGQGSGILGADKKELMRHYEILRDCEELANTSVNFETVLLRSEMLLYELSYFCSWETFSGVDYLARCGIKFKTPPSALLKIAHEKAPAVLCAAVDRALDAEISDALKLKTACGQEARMRAFVEKIHSLDGVPAEVLKYVSNLPVMDALHEPTVEAICPACGRNFQGRPHAHKDFILVCPKCNEEFRMNPVKAPAPGFYVGPFDRPEFKRYFDLSEKINDSRLTVEQRLEFCEKSLDVLPVVTSVYIAEDDDLPPVMACRDFGPEYYMRLGRWDDAQRLISTLSDCRAYYPDGGTDMIEYYQRYKSTAEAALQFLAENPGFIQRDIYKAIGGSVDVDCLKHFVRCSYQIRKEPYGKTNKLYVA